MLTAIVPVARLLAPTAVANLPRVVPALKVAGTVACSVLEIGTMTYNAIAIAGLVTWVARPPIRYTSRKARAGLARVTHAVRARLSTADVTEELTPAT